jgi:serine/threonine-protein kinase
MDFITKEALIAAMHAWVLNKSLPLSQVLQDQGALSTARRLVLDALVEEHIKVHNNDAQKSLAAVSSIGSVRQELSRIADPDLQSSLPLVSAAQKEPDDPLRTVAPSSLGESTSTGSRFRILRPHAKGGLGQVSVAIDQELDRPVALKEIQDRHADEPHSRARFVQEAEITGKLEHPGIIPVYGLGHDASGRPFYAMRFIHGDSLKETIAAFHGDEALKRDAGARSLRLRELLRRFTDVCNAVAYAHSRGVLHRDLKPGNIMLGPYGETLLVDWGLAKPVGAPLAEPSSGDGPSLTEGPIRLSSLSGSRAETVAGSMVGTPAYASPEQVAGRLDLLGPASDVYGLGATLYALLTGQPPVQADEVEDVLRRVQQGEIPPPRSLDTTIPRPLEAICLKAMALQPEGRYPSARALAGDVTRWLDDAPVLAYREPVTIRAGRWMRRHRTLVTSAAAVLVFGVIGLAGFASVLAGKNQQLDAKNTELAGKNQQLDAKNVELAEKNQELDRQRQRAEEREALAIDAVKKFRDVVTANPELKNRPELDALRKALLQEPLEFFRKLRDQLQAERDTRPETLVKVANANLELARTTVEISGNIKDTFQSINESLAIYERLAHNHPDVAEYQVGLADSFDFVALFRGMIEPAEGLKAHEKALAIRERLARDHPTVVKYQVDRARSFGRIGFYLSIHLRPAEAMEWYRKRLAIFERLVRDYPAVTEYQEDLAGGYGHIEFSLYVNDRRGEGLESLQKALAIRERLARDHPTVVKYQVGLAENYDSVGLLLTFNRRPIEALESYRRSLPIRERLARDHPVVIKYQSLLATTHEKIGTLLSSLGRAAEALEASRKALTIWERLVRDHPTVADYHGGLGNALNSVAMIDMSQGRWREARQGLERAVEHQREALSSEPSHRIHRSVLLAQLLNLVKVHRALNQPAEAIRAARECAGLGSKAAGDLYNVACALSLTVPLATGAQRRTIAIEAVETLKQAVIAGWNNAQHASRDPDLAPLRDRDDFRRLLAELFDRGFPADPFAR